MTAYATMTSMNTAASRCASAVACSSARAAFLLDTARLLAVSICVLDRIILPYYT